MSDTPKHNSRIVITTFQARCLVCLSNAEYHQSISKSSKVGMYANDLASRASRNFLKFAKAASNSKSTYMASLTLGALVNRGWVTKNEQTRLYRMTEYGYNVLQDICTHGQTKDDWQKPFKFLMPY